jgi:hypothetical protein
MGTLLVSFSDCCGSLQERIWSREGAKASKLGVDTAGKVGGEIGASGVGQHILQSAPAFKFGSKRIVFTPSPTAI